ncbi:MAG: hypothetical protein GY774_27180 [Planctomycetes bacterium]|nr:hypothetical protein [Planctomycetota bacterium]
MAEKAKFSRRKTSIDSQLLKLIKQTEDPVKPTVNGWRKWRKWRESCRAEFWCFRPAWWKFIVITLIFVLFGIGKLLVTSISYDYTILTVLLRLSAPIFVIGISITTLAHRLGESGDFTAEYLHEACRLPVFACQSFWSILFAFTALALPSEHFLYNYKPLLMYAALGSTLAIIPSFLFIILTLIRCANPKEAIKATTKFSTTRLVNAFAKDNHHKIYQQSRQTGQDKKAGKYKPPSEEEWDIHLMKIQNAFKKAVEVRDLEQIQGWLNSFLKPIDPVFEICKEFPPFKESNDYNPIRLYKMAEIYELVFAQLLVLDKRENLWFVERGTFLIIQAVIKEVRQMFGNENYYCLRPLCWVVVRLYKQLLDSEYSSELRRQRAYFGSFYAHTQNHLKKLPDDCPPETKSDFRQILHEGLTSWLLTVIKEGDNELVKSLCEAGRELVFADETIDLKTDKALIQHLVLAGKLISDRLDDNTDTVSAKNIEMLFSDDHRLPKLSLSVLARIYKQSYLTLASDLYRFVEELGDAWEITHSNPLRGSYGSTGTRYRGGFVHFKTGFLYAAALIIEQSGIREHIPIDITSGSGSVSVSVKARLSELIDKHKKLETDGGSIMETYFGMLKEWIDECAKKKTEQDK